MLGRGTTFRVLLPAAQPTIEVRAQRDGGTPEPSRKLKVLVIDDEPMVVASLRRVLGRAHEVTQESNARTALSRIESGEDFEVILCDLMMPEVTGMEFYERLHELKPELAPLVVFLSGGAFTSRAQDFLRKASNRCLEKPLDRKMLLDVVAGFA